MKNLILILLTALALQATFSQENYFYYNDYINPRPQTIPNHLQPWWGGVRIGYIAVVYIDFPDGRYNDNGILKQPYYDRQLDSIPNLDAAGEVGVIKTNGNFSIKASKYDWYDRWNMLFDSL